MRLKNHQVYWYYNFYFIYDIPTRVLVKLQLRGSTPEFKGFCGNLMSDATQEVHSTASCKRPYTKWFVSLWHIYQWKGFPLILHFGTDYIFP